jgi:hypothetical protein
VIEVENSECALVPRAKLAISHIDRPGAAANQRVRDVSYPVTAPVLVTTSSLLVFNVQPPSQASTELARSSYPSLHTRPIYAMFGGFLSQVPMCAPSRENISLKSTSVWRL